MAGRGRPPKITALALAATAQDEPLAAMAERAMSRAEELKTALDRRKHFFIYLYLDAFKDNEDIVDLAKREEAWIVEIENTLMSLHATCQRIEYSAQRGGQ